MKSIHGTNLLMFILVLITSSVNAEWIDVRGYSVNLELPNKNWKIKKDLLDIPLIALSPIKEKSRYTFSVTPIMEATLSFDEKLMQETQKDYQKGREDWLVLFNGEFIKWSPYKKTNWVNTQEVHHVGFEFSINGFHYVENSFYIQCKDQLFLVKEQYRKNEYQGLAEGYSKTLKNSFKCKSRYIGEIR